MNRYVFLIIILLGLNANQSVAQKQKSIWGKISSLEKKADKKFKNYEYKAASILYLKAIKKGNKRVYFKLTECFNLLNESENAVKWFSEAEKNKIEFDKEKIQDYADALSEIGQYEKAKELYRKFLEIEKNNPIVKAKLNSLNNVPQYFKLSKHIEIKGQKYNSEFSEFSPAYFNDKIVFLSNRPLGTKSTKFLWDNTNFLDIYEVNPETNQVSKFHHELNSEYHEGPMTFDNSNEIYFTRTNFLEGKLKNSFSRVSKLKIYHSSYSNQLKTWSKPTEFTHNKNEYSTGHPSLDEENGIMYFVSDRSDGYGGTDIYVSHRNNNQWSAPENVGNEINTSGNEMFPFIMDDFLFFASNGHGGLGGLDLFVVNLKDEKKVVKNLGSPLNSSKDDFGLIIEENLQNGYISSNREGGKGMDDIYKFHSNYPLALEFFVKGKVLDSLTKQPISTANILFDDTESDNSFNFTADEHGEFNFVALPSQNYRITTNKNSYNTSHISFSTNIETEKQKEWYVEIPLNKKVLKEEMDLAKELELNPIYFDLGKWDIRADASKDLDKIVEALSLNPEIRLDLGSHTDSRGSDAYNLILSEKRAKSTAEYIISQGIEADRINYKGHGETKLLNNCDNGIKCSKEEHQLNRRTEFIVNY